MISLQDIKRAQRFAKVYAWIHVPLKRKPMTQEVQDSRDRRAAKLWAQIFNIEPTRWNEVKDADQMTTIRILA